MNTKIEKDVRSSINRRGNCDAANADKQVEAAHAQLADIKALITIGEFNRLPQEIRECARLRLDNPEFSLTEIGQACDPPVSKSAVARRLKKLKDYIK
jgi:DNA-binding protein WhiA